MAIAPKPELPEDSAMAQATARATESLARIEQRRNEVFDARAEAIARTRQIVTSKAVRRAGGAELEPLLNEIENAAAERIETLERERKDFAATMKRVRGGLPAGVKKRRAVAKG